MAKWHVPVGSYMYGALQKKEGEYLSWPLDLIAKSLINTTEV